jgi:hypothetical protein
VHACLAREEQDDERGKEHHVSGQREENKEADSLQALAGSFSGMLPVVVPSPPASAGRTAIDRWLPSNSGFLSFNFRWGAAKGDGHGEASVSVR